MSLKLFNSLTREKEEFKPLEEGKVKFYSCGQTIYDDLHVGNARAYIFWDTLRRYLEFKGYTVRHVQNITDVGHLTDDGDQGEDKVEKRANELGIEPMELVEDQIERYFEDTKAVNVERQDIVPRATGHIHEMIEYVKKIIENGYGYEIDGNVYFDVEKFAEDYPYGEMANKDLEQLKEEAQARVEHDDRKRNQYDFALWINADESHLMKWSSPWSEGYPGWHLECSVMSQKYLGDEFDIHAGGKDHIFPHHPNERAQCFAATGKGQANYWLHNEFITVEGEKMSKSKGNFYTVRDLIEEGYSGDAIRMYVISSHYRSETDFSKDGLEQAEKELSAIRSTVQKIRKSDGDDLNLNESPEDIRDGFETYMDNDLHTARAKQFLMEKVRLLSSALSGGDSVKDEYADVLVELFGVLGVNMESDVSRTESEMADTLVELREKFRENEDWETSDYIRDRLGELGFEIEDREDGAVWYR
ncbi:cysteine--tRNA ligase [Candidatus Nanohalococcus occultus]|uniref:cysteine--tRNA ligase n=1 Tax=Candidatus Nanohalococcus occultus TaxID=2978047 RepID=UPI0039E1AEEA